MSWDHPSGEKNQLIINDNQGKIREKINTLKFDYDTDGTNTLSLEDRWNIMQKASLNSKNAGKVGARQEYLYVDGNTVGSYGGIDKADFDYNYQSIPDSQVGAGSSYTTRAGDTLVSIARSLWGDSSLWYLLADANALVGINPNAAAGSVGGFAIGQSLTIPNKITNLQNNSSTLKPYSPASIIGDTSPTVDTPMPPVDKGCGVVGQIIVIIVAIVVSVVSYGVLSGYMAG